MTTTTSVKDEMRQMLDRLPNDLTWDDLIDSIRLRQAIEQGLRDIEEGRTVPHAEVMRRMGLEP
jgi:predicted transcriptional regulator